MKISRLCPQVIFSKVFLKLKLCRAKLFDFYVGYKDKVISTIKKIPYNELLASLVFSTISFQKTAFAITSSC